MRTLRLIVAFYKSFAVASLLITLSCLLVTYTWGIHTFTPLFWFKIITLGILFYYIQNYKAEDFYYYKNLGVTRKLLWISTLTFDFMLFLVLIILTLKVR